ncbi:MAG: hypothetical protein WCN88_01055 [Candidatus Falkowbacteria bacterium]
MKLSFYRQVKINRKILIIASVILVLMTIISYYLIRLFSLSGSEIALAELEKSYSAEPICHVKCDIWRREKEQIIIKDLKKFSPKATKRMEKYWSFLPDDSRFKIEIAQIALLAYGENNPPVYLKEYLDNPSADLKLLREIIIRFNSLAVNNRILINNLSKIAKNASSSEIKIAAIQTLKEINNDGEIGNYFKIINSNSELNVKLELVKNISNIRDKQNIFTKEQLEIIKNIIVKGDTENPLRQSLVQLLGDYYLIYPDESISIWQSVYKNEALDSISRSFSADYINHLTNTNLDIPTVSDNEWQDYYNQ